MQDPKTMTYEELRGAIDDCATTIKIQAEFLYHGLPHNITRYVAEAEACHAEIQRRVKEEIRVKTRNEMVLRLNWLKSRKAEGAACQDEIERLERALR